MADPNNTATIMAIVRSEALRLAWPRVVENSWMLIAFLHLASCEASSEPRTLLFITEPQI
jgi:hypothetical protein